jgi:hypothetical protein
VLVAGAGNDARRHHRRRRARRGRLRPRQDTVEGLADPNRRRSPAIARRRQRSFAARPAAEVGHGRRALHRDARHRPRRRAAELHGRADHGAAQARPARQARTLAHTTVPAAAGPVQLRFKLAELSSGFLSRRPSIRVQVDVTAIAADGRRYP